MHAHLTLWAVAVGLLNVPLIPLPEKEIKTPEVLYRTHGGMWQPVDKKDPLEVIWIHQNEKAPETGTNESRWRVTVRFNPKGPENYDGPPNKVEVEGNTLKITIPGPDDRAKQRVICIEKKGDQFQVQLHGFKAQGTFAVERRPSKQ